MRDPKRIEPFLSILAEAWHKYPDLRFGQFMVNFFGSCKRDPFFPEEDEWAAALQAFIDKKDPGEAMDACFEKKYGALEE